MGGRCHRPNAQGMPSTGAPPVPQAGAPVQPQCCSFRSEARTRWSGCQPALLRASTQWTATAHLGCSTTYVEKTVAPSLSTPGHIWGHRQPKAPARCRAGSRGGTCREAACTPIGCGSLWPLLLDPVADGGWSRCGQFAGSVTDTCFPTAT